MKRSHNHPGRTGMTGANGALDLVRWQEQLVHRHHGALARPRPFRELSARIAHNGGNYYFPLGTDHPEEAAARAQEIHHAAVAEGWASALDRHTREFTLAIFWLESPMVFTYTTLYTRVGRHVPGRLRQGKKISIAIIEPDPGCRSAMTDWAGSLPDYSCRGSFSEFAEALDASKTHPADLILFNRQLPEFATNRFCKAIQARAQRVPTIGYRIYDTSDELFYSQPAIASGYYFRRRPPDRLLEPLQDAWQNGLPSLEDCQSRVCDFVKKQFIFPQKSEDDGDPLGLTSREREILGCLRKGCTDKEIARALEISAWTVHAHLKKIYGKLGARSRTEAVIRSLEM